MVMTTPNDRETRMTSPPDVPAPLRRLWGLPEEPQRLGRPAVLDLPRVIAAAIALADADGLPGVTLPKVAKRLGVTGMSLYRYVGSKDELLTLMSHAALDPPPEIDPEAGWRTNLRALVEAQRATLMRHSWQADIPVSGPPSGPQHIAWVNAQLGAMRDTALDWGEKLGVIVVLSGFVQQTVRLSNELARGRGADTDQATTEQEYGRALLGLVDPERFPHAAEMFASHMFEIDPDGPGNADDFEYGLELILDGVAATVARAEQNGRHRH